jgi:hypothetical protein
VRAIISAPEGLEVRKRPAEIRLAMLEKAYAGLLAGVPQEQVKAVVLATHALSSASVWSHMRDYCGVSGAEGGKIAAQAIELIVEATRARAKAAAA